MPGQRKLYAKPLFHLALGILAVSLDLWSKWWARETHSLSNGEPNPLLTTPVIGDWLRFRLSFNENAAFGLAFQELLPFLHATVFYSVVYVGLVLLLLRMYFNAGSAGDLWSRVGISLVISGGLGNVVDRLVHSKVTDFIDVDFFDVSWTVGPLGQVSMGRWPTFNLADVWIVVGGALLFVLPLFGKRRSDATKASEKLWNQEA